MLRPALLATLTTTLEASGGDKNQASRTETHLPESYRSEARLFDAGVHSALGTHKTLLC